VRRTFSIQEAFMAKMAIFLGGFGVQVQVGHGFTPVFFVVLGAVPMTLDQSGAMETLCTDLNIAPCANPIHLIRFFLSNLHL